jgi:ABC-2 type transport system ATP-binding protein
MLEIIDLHKTFHNADAVNGISFNVEKGQVFGLLGPNGAGKTTTIRLIMNILRPDSGEIYFNQTARQKIPHSSFGYLPEERGLYQRATVLNMLTYFGTLNKLSNHKAEVEAIRQLDKFGLVDYTQAKVFELSKGMQQKIQFITAILHDPEILILDEPFIGLDPVNQLAFTEEINEMKEQGKYIILSSHQMDQVEKLSDKICLMNQGKVVLEGEIENLKKKYQENAYYIESDDDLTKLKDLTYIQILEQKNKGIKVTIKNTPGNLNKFIKILFDSFNIRKFEVVEPTLHDIFIKLIRKESKNNVKDNA